MTRILALLVCASLLSCTLASGSATTKPSGSTTTKRTTTVPSTTLPPTTRGPTHGPLTESPGLEVNNTFVLYDGDEVCLKMIINMTVVYTYTNASNSSQTVTQLDPMDGLATIVYDNNSSFCQLNGPSARLALRWLPIYGEGGDPHIMAFKFCASKDKGKRHWTFDNVHLDVIFSRVDFPDYQNPNISSISYKGKGFFKDKIEYERGYQCLASQDHDLNSLTDEKIAAKVTVQDFHIQAFVFKDPGVFGNARKCLADSGNGNKIVPIAVGVALAVLVILVIIAFFISKLVNRRRQISYESLN